MIARHWKGLARADRAAEYEAHLRDETFPSLARIGGFVDASMLRRDHVGGVEFLIVTRWKSIDAIRQFAGDDPEAAVVPARVQAMMIDYDRRAVHYEVMEQTSSVPEIRLVDRLDQRLIGELAALTKDCVDGGASIGFMQPFTIERGREFWRKVADAVASGQRALLVAEDGHGVCGTVQLILDLPDNQPHRADVAKMQVHSRARRKGLCGQLLHAAEQAARDRDKTLLVLDAVTDGDAARLYARLGWVRVGDIPNYALFPQGGYCSTTYFYKNLAD
jgi:GNAT superfamily N-acetyltransferase/heme-degrading monooxygenase HmoA